MKINHTVAIVTGASSGIGLTTAKLFTEKGAQVALAARSERKLKQLSETLPGSSAFVTDMAKEKEVRDMVRRVLKHYGRIDILINNAGQGYDADVMKIDTETFRQVAELDLVGPLIAMQEVVPPMRKQGGGSIVNISSGTALMYLPGMGAYAALKRALSHLSLTAREELKDDGITVGVVYPYITATDFEKNTIRAETPEKEEWDGDRDLPAADPPEYVAEKILEAVTTGAPEIFAHDWMGKRRR